ncbi:unnamed protein product, partial [Adineta steineri]
MFRQFFDTSFNDYRQARVVVQELLSDPKKPPLPDFQRFCTSLFTHKNYTNEQFKLEYSFVKESLIIEEASLNEIQLYRRPLAFIYFTVSQTSKELRDVLDQFTKIKQKQKDVFVHLFVRYKNVNSIDDDDEISTDGKLDNITIDESDYAPSSYRPSVSSMMSVDSYHTMPYPLSTIKQQDSMSLDETGSVTSDSVSLTNSLTGPPVFQGIGADNVIGDDDDSEDATISIETPTKTSDKSSKKVKRPFLKSLTLATSNIRDSFDTDLTKVLHCLEANLAKYVSESKQSNGIISSIDSQLADIRLMVNSEDNCSLLQSRAVDHNGFNHDRVFKSTLNEFNMRIMLIIFNHYTKANTIVTAEAAKNKLGKKIIDARVLKRKADCYLLLGSVDRAQQTYRRAAEALKSQNDILWHAAALEGRVAANCLSTNKSKTR